MTTIMVGVLCGLATVRRYGTERLLVQREASNEYPLTSSAAEHLFAGGQTLFQRLAAPSHLPIVGRNSPLQVVQSGSGVMAMTGNRPHLTDQLRMRDAWQYTTAALFGLFCARLRSCCTRKKLSWRRSW